MKGCRSQTHPPDPDKDPIAKIDKMEMLRLRAEGVSNYQLKLRFNAIVKNLKKGMVMRPKDTSQNVTRIPSLKRPVMEKLDLLKERIAKASEGKIGTYRVIVA